MPIEKEKEKEKEQNEEPTSKKHRLQVGTNNFISQLFFVWLFPFIFRLRRDKSNFKDIELLLRKSEQAEFNDTILDKKWQKEIQKAAKQNR